MCIKDYVFIDPPYNTGNDFVYEDDFAQSTDEYLANSGQFDEDGNRMVQNTESNGRFHTDWLNMIYPRIKLAKDLLSDDGVIFISIGQTESHNLIKCCDEIFGGESNRVGIISRVMKSGGNKGQYFSPNVEYIPVYAKNISCLGYFREAISEDIAKTYNHIESNGEKKGQRFTIKGLCQPGLGNRPNQRYWIEAPDGTYLIPRGVSFPEIVSEGEKVLPQDADTCWKWTYQRYMEEKVKGNIYFQKSKSATALVNEKNETAEWNVFNKIWLADRENEGRVPVDLITKWENRISSDELKKIGIPFDFAKPVDLIKYLISLVVDDRRMIILDFFSGSATTAHAVMQLNAEDGGHRKFIMVQLPEVTDEKSEAYKAGYKNICEIGKERIRRAGQKIRNEQLGIRNDVDNSSLLTPNSSLDIGFRVLKCDTSNMKEVYYNPAEYEASLFSSLEDNIKEDRTPEDLLFQVMLDLGILLSSKIEKTTIGGCKVFNVADGFLYACFDNNISDEVVTAIAKKQPYYAVFRDSGMASDSVLTNFDQIFASISPSTVRKVL
ncbi:site-specific DNA-methyltransferase [Ruminococcus sp.]|uniref:site-specific DNA-methyltransferase n=1 Tax=Ruminococcus sp. TaxID=41978 RepID=UPI00351F9C0D